MTKNMRALFVAPVLAAALGVPSAVMAGRAAPGNSRQQEPKTEVQIAKEVRHRLVMLPFYTVFDNLEYKVDGDKVTLYGQVVLPVLKSDAEGAVKSIEGVSTVVNHIEVLPVSPMDSQLRRAVFRAIYGDTSLSRYAIQAVPPIHIIVNNGNVTLVGVVATESDRNLANLRASQVPNVFSVKNNLTVEKE